MKNLNNKELENLCLDLYLNGNSYSSQFDSELKMMQNKLSDRLGKESEDLNNEELMLLSSLCLNSNRKSQQDMYNKLNHLRRN